MECSCFQWPLNTGGGQQKKVFNDLVKGDCYWLTGVTTHQKWKLQWLRGNIFGTLYRVTDHFIQGDWLLYTGWLTALYTVTDCFIQGDWPLYTGWLTALYRVTDHFIQGDFLIHCHLTQVWLYFTIFSHRPFFFHLVLIYLLLINNSNSTKWSPIWFVIICVINKIGWPWSWSLICLLRVWLQAELENTKSYYQFIKTTTNLREKVDITDMFSWKTTTIIQQNAQQLCQLMKVLSTYTGMTLQLSYYTVQLQVCVHCASSTQIGLVITIHIQKFLIVLINW